MAKIYLIQIVLTRIEPKIWRRLLIPSDILLLDFHKIIQTAMGWTNSHLHQFIKDRTFYTERMDDDWGWDELRNVEYQRIKLSSLLKTVNSKITYEYDFGDGWIHEIILEKILRKDVNLYYPICLDGERCCPPEDCGGVGGYKSLMEILSNPTHEEYESYLEWLDGKFQPEFFNISQVNKLLRLKEYGCF